MYIYDGMVRDGLHLRIDNEGNIIKEAEIIVKEDIEKAGFLDYLKQNLKL